MATSASANPPVSPSLASWPSVLSAQSPNSPKRRGRAKRPPPRPPRGGRRSPSNDGATENCPPRKAGGRLLRRSSRQDGGRRSQSSGPPAKRAKSNRAVDSEGRATERGRDYAAPAAVREGIHDGKNESFPGVRAGKRDGEHAEFLSGADGGDPAEENGGFPNAGRGRKPNDPNSGGGRKPNDEEEDIHTDDEGTHEGDAGASKEPLPNDYIPDAPPKIATVKEVVKRMLCLLHVDDKIRSARARGAADEEKYCKQMKAKLTKETRRVFEEGIFDEIFDNIQRLKSNCEPGLYALYFSISQLIVKLGMSAVKYGGKMKRAEKQKPYKIAVDVCDMDTLNKIYPDESEIVQAILHLMPPSLQFHPDKRRQMLDHMKMQIAELMIASRYETCTGTAGERLMQWPSESIQKLTALRPADSYSAEDKSFLHGGDRIFRTTWSTYKSDLDRRAEAGDEVLSRNLHSAPPDRFTNLHFFRRVFGLDEVPIFKDALEVSPRTVQMRGIKTDLERNLNEALAQLVGPQKTISIEKKQDIRDIIGTIDKDSDHYGHYIRPALEHLAKAAVLMMRATLEEDAKDGDIVVWERVMYDAMKICETEAFDEIFPPDSSDFVEVVEDTNVVLRITTVLPSGKVVKHEIIRSYFCMVAEETSLEVRISAARSYIELLSYHAAGGQITRKHAEREAAIIQSFLMELEGYKGKIDDHEVDGSFRAARNHHVGEGIARGQGMPKNVRSMSMLLGIGPLELLDIRSSMDRQLFGVLLNVFGVDTGPDNLTPLDADFSCPGVEAVAGLPARPCPHNGCEEDDRPYVFLAGKDIADFSLELKFRCETCARSAYYREKMHLEQRIESQDASITDPQRQRVAEMKATRERTNETMREAMRAKYRNDPAHREQKKASNREYNKRNREQLKEYQKEYYKQNRVRKAKEKAEERKNDTRCNGDPDCVNKRTWTGYCMTCFESIKQRTGCAPKAII